METGLSEKKSVMLEINGKRVSGGFGLMWKKVAGNDVVMNGKQKSGGVGVKNSVMYVVHLSLLTHVVQRPEVTDAEQKGILPPTVAARSLSSSSTDASTSRQSSLSPGTSAPVNGQSTDYCLHLSVIPYFLAVAVYSQDLSAIFVCFMCTYLLTYLFTYFIPFQRFSFTAY